MTRRRPLALAAVALALAGALTACQAEGGFTRADAQRDAADWTTQAVDAAATPAPTATTKLSGFEACRTDTGYFTTTEQWRTITNIAVAPSRQASATAAIVAGFVSSGWKVSRPRGLVTLQGGGTGKRRGLITVQTAGESGLAITVESPCYA